MALCCAVDVYLCRVWTDAMSHVRCAIVHMVYGVWCMAYGSVYSILATRSILHPKVPE